MFSGVTALRNSGKQSSFALRVACLRAALLSCARINAKSPTPGACACSLEHTDLHSVQAFKVWGLKALVLPGWYQGPALRTLHKCIE